MKRPETFTMRDGDVVLVHAPGGSRVTDVPVTIHLDGDVLVLGVYLHDGDWDADRYVSIPISELESGSV